MKKFNKFKKKIYLFLCIFFLIGIFLVETFSDMWICLVLTTLFFILYKKKQPVKKFYRKEMTASFKVLKEQRSNLIKELSSLNEEIEKANKQISIANATQKEIEGIKLKAQKFEKTKIVINSELENLEQQKNTLIDDINFLKQEKALLINDIEQNSINKISHSKNSDIYFSIDYVDTIQDGLKFEQYFAELLDKLGYYDIRITSSSSDFGVDVIAYNDDICYGFQCKLYSNEVGNSAIQEAYAGIKHYNCNIGIVVTNNFFTEQAHKQAKDTNIILWDRTILSNKLKQANNRTFTINGV